MDAGERKALEDIEAHGCHILHVLESEEYPGFSYSIGLQKTAKQPDVVIVGLDREVAHWMINEYSGRVRSGDNFEHGRRYSGFLEGFDVQARRVAEENHSGHFGWARWLYGDVDFQYLQLVYPSTSGVWPWDSEEEEMAWHQRLL